MRGTVPVVLGYLLAASAIGSGLVPISHAVAHEQLLRCATAPIAAPASSQSAYGVQHFGGRGLYAPVRNAMFFSQAGSGCHWKAPRRRHG